MTPGWMSGFVAFFVPVKCMLCSTGISRSPRTRKRRHRTDARGTSRSSGTFLVRVHKQLTRRLIGLCSCKLQSGSCQDSKQLRHCLENPMTLPLQRKIQRASGSSLSSTVKSSPNLSTTTYSIS
ncbi:hypothetical protein V8F06_008438 [Rhypophila decipiens]